MVLAFVMAPAMCLADSAYSDSVPGWDIAQRLITYGPENMSPATPYGAIMATSDGKTHIFWREHFITPDDPTPDVTWYIQIDEANVIHDPIDIRVDRGTEALRAAEDCFGDIHLLAYIEGQRLVDIAVPADRVSSAHAWMTGLFLPLDIIVPWHDLVTDASGILHLVYPAHRDEKSEVIYSYQSARYSWGPPIPVFSSSSEEAPIWTKIAVDGRGRVHIVWAMGAPPDWYPPKGLYYAQSTDGGETWSEPLQLAGEGAANPSIVTVGNDEVHVVWGSSLAYSIVSHQWSADGGKSWSPIEIIAERSGGLLGAPAVAVDSSGTLHVVTTSEGAAVYLTWKAGVWSSPLRIWEDSVNEPRATISGGNRLHVIFTDDKGLVYLARSTDAPAVGLLSGQNETFDGATEVVPSATPSLSVAGSLDRTAEDARVELAMRTVHETQFSDSMIPVAWAVMSVLVVVLAIIIARLVQYNRRQP